MSSRIRVDVDRQEVWAGGRAIRTFTYKEFTLLRVLLSANGRILTRVRLLRLVWGYDAATALLVSRTTRTVDKHIEQVRRKLGTGGKLILTISGQGYRMIK